MESMHMGKKGMRWQRQDNREYGHEDRRTENPERPAHPLELSTEHTKNTERLGWEIRSSIEPTISLSRCIRCVRWITNKGGVARTTINKQRTTTPTVQIYK